LDLHGESLSWIAVGKSPGAPGDAAHGNPNTRSIRLCRGRINLPSHTPQRIDDPFRVGRFSGGVIRWRRYACHRLLPSRPSACDRNRRFCHAPPPITRQSYVNSGNPPGSPGTQIWWVECLSGPIAGRFTGSGTTPLGQHFEMHRVARTSLPCAWRSATVPRGT
jgi:hypothetical protein